MKRLALLCFGTLLMLLITRPAHGSVRVCNGTFANNVRFSFVFGDDAKGRVVRGWWTIDSGGCVTVHEGDARRLAEDLWVFAEQGNLVWNQRPTCAGYFVRDCGPSNTRTFCVNPSYMPSLPEGYPADIPKAGCEQSSRVFVKQENPANEPDLTINLVQLHGQRMITTSNLFAAKEYIVGHYAPDLPPWHTSTNPLGYVAGCNADQDATKPYCDSLVYWHPPEEDQTVCSFIGHENSPLDNGSCSAQLVGEKTKKWIEIKCHANEHAGYKAGGGHAYYYLDYVVVSSDPMQCAPELVTRCELKQGDRCQLSGQATMPGIAYCKKSSRGEVQGEEYKCDDHLSCRVRCSGTELRPF